jgi:hypothetical protein
VSHQIVRRSYCVSAANGTANYVFLETFEGSVGGCYLAGEDLVRAIFERANQMRQKKGLPPFRRDPRLDRAAQAHADDLAAGRAHAHDQLEYRVHTLGGFPDEPCHVSRASMAANYTEGIVDQPDDVGPMSLDVLTHFGPGEGHYDDFYDPKINCVGVGIGLDGHGYMKNHLVLDYGVLCKLPDPGPEPATPLDRDDFNLW